MSVRAQSYEDFVEVHGLLLAGAGLPWSLHRKLFEKLTSESFDAGAFFRIDFCEASRRNMLVLTAESMEKESNVFLADHAWTFRLSDAYRHLEEFSGLAHRLASLMCLNINSNSKQEDTIMHDVLEKTDIKLKIMDVIDNQIQLAKNKGNETLLWLELEHLGIDDDTLLSIDLPSRFPDLLALNLIGNRLVNAEFIICEVRKFKNLRALWLNDNPSLNCCAADLSVARLLEGCPKLEICNSHLTHNYGEWALGICGGMHWKNSPCYMDQIADHLLNVTSLNLSNRQIHSLINKSFSPVKIPHLSHLNIRGNPVDEDSSSELFKMLNGFPCLQSLEVDVPGPLADNAAEIIDSLPNLHVLNGAKASTVLKSGKKIIDSMREPLIPEWKPDEPLSLHVISAMWSYIMTYRLADEEKIDETSLWYMMDELGSALRHSEMPNFMVSPFLYMPEGKLESAMSYSILWPILNIQKGDECTRDFLFGIGDDKQRYARLAAYFNTPDHYFIREYNKYYQHLQSRNLTYSCKTPSSESLCQTDGRQLSVFTDVPQVEEFLTRPEFRITNEVKEADIIWTSIQIDDNTRKALGVTNKQYINQFPFEACLVMKHHLAETVHEAYGSPEWLQPTYNLESQLPLLIGNFCDRKRNGMDNLWILKPWNMARTIDTTITDDLSAIIRLMETGPKICQKYIEHPALFQGKKFDLRYIVLVRSMQPVEMFIADAFWVRLANNEYSLEKHSFFDYETHFTVMNYRGRLKNMDAADFVREFEREHQVDWFPIHEAVKKMIRLVFEAAAIIHPEMHSPTSRAIYGVDVMIDCSFKPKLLEVTYCPDCTRACKYDTEAIFGRGRGSDVKGRDFYNYVFGCLFLGETAHVSPL